MLSLNEVLPNAPSATADALTLFDSRPAVEPDFMIGTWQGLELPTNHPGGPSMRPTHREQATDQPAIVCSGSGSDFLARTGPRTAAPNGRVSRSRATALTSSNVTASIRSSV